MAGVEGVTEAPGLSAGLSGYGEHEASSGRGGRLEPPHVPAASRLLLAVGGTRQGQPGVVAVAWIR